MYKDHCPVIAQAMREDFRAFQRGIMLEPDEVSALHLSILPLEYIPF